MLLAHRNDQRIYQPHWMDNGQSCQQLRVVKKSCKATALFVTSQVRSLPLRCVRYLSCAFVTSQMRSLPPKCVRYISCVFVTSRMCLLPLMCVRYHSGVFVTTHVRCLPLRFVRYLSRVFSLPLKSILYHSDAFIIAQMHSLPLIGRHVNLHGQLLLITVINAISKTTQTLNWPVFNATGKAETMFSDNTALQSDHHRLAGSLVGGLVGGLVGALVGGLV